jgi:type II secretory pathway component PulK
MRQTTRLFVRGRRRGAMLLISVLACLTLVMLLVAAWVRAIGQERRQLRSQQNCLQAVYLAESGLRRAAAQLAKNAKYEGEIWRIDGEMFHAAAGATIAVRVESVSDDAQARRVRAIADFPAEGTARARRSQEVTIVLLSGEETP